METIKTLEEQLIDYETLIRKKFRKEYYTGIGLICLCILLSMGLSYYFLYKHSSFWLIIFSLLVMGLLLYLSHRTVVNDKKNNQFVILDLEYRQAQECQKLEKNRSCGELIMESLWSYPFTY